MVSNRASIVIRHKFQLRYAINMTFRLLVFRIESPTLTFGLLVFYIIWSQTFEPLVRMSDLIALSLGLIVCYNLSPCFSIIFLLWQLGSTLHKDNYIFSSLV